MADVLFVLILFGFFALSVGLVRLCERIVGGGDVTLVDASPEAPVEDAA